MSFMNTPVQDISPDDNNTNSNATAGSTTKVAGTYIARLILKIKKSLEDLGCNTSGEENNVCLMAHMEQMSIFVHDSMSISSRNYHSVQHVFDILSSSTNDDFRNDPIATLAGIFHDCVYYNIDGGFSSSQEEKLAGAYVIIHNKVVPGQIPIIKLQTHPDSDNDPLVSMVLQIFGFHSGQELNPMGGQNEYLSAVIAVRELAKINLSPKALAQIAICIEATTPFRPSNKVTGKTAMETLYDNVQEAVIRFGLQMSNTEIIQSIQRAVLLSNEDVSNFASDDQSWFLDNTWSLLPESNVALRQQNLYTVQEFQFAVFKMYGFFNFLQPTVIFQQFHNVPCNEELELRTQLAKQNLEIGKLYIAAKLISISVLAALAVLTGGDAPISLFVGDLPTKDRTPVRLDDFMEIPNSISPSNSSIESTKQSTVITKGDIKLTTSSTRTSILLTKNSNSTAGGVGGDSPELCNPIVYRLLAEGRSRESTFDVKQSPLAAYFYYHIGDIGMEQIFTVDMVGTPIYPMNVDSAKKFLLALPDHAVKYVASKVAILAISRTNRITTVINELYNNNNK